MIKPIHHTFGPHITLTYLLQSWKQLLTPWNWRKGYQREKLRSNIQYWFHAKCFLFSSGREALLALLRSLDFEPGSEVIIQGYTCVALPNAIHAADYTPIFADIDPHTLNMRIENVEKCITPRTKVIICQHTFGIPSDTKTLRALCDKHHLVLIEDLAHILPDTSGPEIFGKYADYMMLSFGRDKAISGICGGAVISKHNFISDEIETEEQRAKDLSFWKIGTLLLYPTLYACAKTIYGIGIGKLLLLVARQFHLLIPVITTKEKKGTQSPIVKRMPNACAALVNNGLHSMQAINDHRRLLTALYLKAAKKYHWDIPSGISADLPLQKFPLLVENADAVRTSLKKYNIHLDDGWTGSAVCPRSVDLSATGYKEHSCPKAEVIAQSILTLPTHSTMTIKQAQYLIHRLQS